MNLDYYGLLVNRELVKSDLSIAGLWHGRADENEMSDLIIKFLEDEIFMVEGCFYTGGKKVFNRDGDEYFIMDNNMNFNGSGKYSIEDNNITIKGIIIVEQETSIKRYTVHNTLKGSIFKDSSYSRKIDFSSKYIKKSNGDMIKFHIENPDGIISFEDEVFNGEQIVKGFRDFIAIVETRPI